MKSITKLLAALLAMAFIGDAMAQSSPVVVRLTGSTAYRNQIHAALAHLFGAGGTGTQVTGNLSAGNSYGWVGSSFLGSSYSIFKGTLNSQDVIVKCAWSGSTGGIRDVSQSNAINFLQDVATTSEAGTASLPATYVAEIADITIGDTSPDATPYTQNPLEEAQGGPVGVIPFVWVAGKGAPAGLNNVSSILARSLFQAGTLPLALFTGASGDEGTLVYATGRDPFSGTRATAFIETGIGANSSVRQFQPQPAPVLNGTTTSLIEWPEQPVEGVTFLQGNGGYTSGGTLATALTTTLPNSACFVSYVSAVGSDLATITGNGGKMLSYNGVSLTLGTFDEIKNGKYSFWSYARVLFRPDAATNVKSVANAVADRVRSVDALITLDTVTMRVGRDVDGGEITPRY